MSAPHIPVLKTAVVQNLLPEGRIIERVIDGTLGAGGHSHALLAAGAKFVLGLDVDPLALEIARATLAPFQDRVEIVHSSYTQLVEAAADLDWESADAILLDLGVSSMQVDQAERGFAFMMEGPLDMRFDPTGYYPPAHEIINNWEEAELSRVFHRYGEEHYSRQIAKAIVAQRPFETTTQLANAIAAAMPAKARRESTIHPATRVFQALRIAVNDELGSIEQTLPQAIGLLRPGGRLAVISFHSLEDRIVKQVFKEAAREVVSPPGMVLEEKKAVVRLVTKKPMIADDDEIAQNPRSRSAKLRVVEKI